MSVTGRQPGPRSRSARRGASGNVSVKWTVPSVPPSGWCGPGNQGSGPRSDVLSRNDMRGVNRSPPLDRSSAARRMAPSRFGEPVKASPEDDGDREQQESGREQWHLRWSCTVRRLHLVLAGRKVDADVARGHHEGRGGLTVHRDRPVGVVGDLQHEIGRGGALDDDLERVRIVGLEERLAARRAPG